MNHNGFGVLIIILIVAFLSSLIVGGAFFIKNTQVQKPSVSTTDTQEVTKVNPTPKPPEQGQTVIAVKFEGSTNFLAKESNKTIFYSFNPQTKIKKDLFQINSSSIELPEAGISPDGTKIYYIVSANPLFVTDPADYVPRLWIYDNKGLHKEYKLSESNLWTISVTTADLNTDHTRGCYFSEDSDKLNCLLEEREKLAGAGTGRSKIVQLDFGSEKISEVSSTNQTAGFNNFKSRINDKEITIESKKYLVKESAIESRLVDNETKEEIDLGGIYLGFGFFSQ